MANFLLYFDRPLKYGTIFITSSMLVVVLLLLVALSSVDGKLLVSSICCGEVSLNGFGEIFSSVFSRL